MKRLWISNLVVRKRGPNGLAEVGEKAGEVEARGEVVAEAHIGEVEEEGEGDSKVVWGMRWVSGEWRPEGRLKAVETATYQPHLTVHQLLAGYAARGMQHCVYSSPLMSKA